MHMFSVNVHIPKHLEVRHKIEVTGWRDNTGMLIHTYMFSYCMHTCTSTHWAG